MPKTILISGIPGCGKSSFGRWLEREHGYQHVDMEHDGLDRSGLRASWDAYHLGSDPAQFTTALSRVASPMVLDWGFPPSCLSTVARMKSDGIEVWWFDGDRLSARALFQKRGTVPLATFDHQFADISANWSEIAPVFGGRILRVVLPDGGRLPDDAIHRAMNETLNAERSAAQPPTPDAGLSSPRSSGFDEPRRSVRKAEARITIVEGDLGGGSRLAVPFRSENARSS